MKIAILISGEYRTFPICRKTMQFLDDPRVDVYFSTWNKSIIKNERLGLDINDTITEEKVRADLGRDARVLVEPVECFESKRYNDKMIHRWCTGFEMIRSSGIVYDYVMVMRPDLFFNVDNNISLASICEVAIGEINVGWFNGDKKYLQDNIFACTYGDIQRLFSDLSVELWVNQDSEGDWHRWWSVLIGKHFAEITRLGKFAGFTFCRPIKSDCNFAEVVEAEGIWTDVTVLKQLAEFGEQFTIDHWSPAVVQRAQAREASGYFDKPKMKVAVIISGMLRNYDAALLSLPVWVKQTDI